MISMKLESYLHHILSLPPHLVMAKALTKGRRRLRLVNQRRWDQKNSTYRKPLSHPSGDLHRYFQPCPISLLLRYGWEIKALASLILSHRFDLLGSGWVRILHGMTCKGLDGKQYKMGSPFQADSEGRWLEGRINRSNTGEAKRIWSLVDQSYIPIDWHLDFKSGYRWSEDIWYLDILHGHKPSVDIKVPWELARMQYLPLLAWAYALAKDRQEGFSAPSVYVRGFRNQVLDFIATNPPRFGVNWKSPMDVSIRVANWLVTYDLFRAYGVEFDNEFKDEFFRSIYEHGLHIIGNLEWNEEFRGNHYISNIVGLLFVAAYLPRTKEVDVWLALAVQELVNEMGLQFNSDGSNFEASTSYHRLSAEMFVYATALVLGLPEKKREALVSFDHRFHTGPPKLKPAPVSLHPLPGENIYMPFPVWYFERLGKMAEFTMDITKPNGHAIQIGDNDSGRFLKLTPVFHQLTGTDFKANYANLNEGTDLLDNAKYLDEDHLDYHHLVSAINGLFEREDFKRFTGDGFFETDLIRSLAKGLSLPLKPHQEQINNAHSVYTEDCRNQNQQYEKLDSPRQPRMKEGKLEEKGMEHRKGFRFNVYPEFGLYIYRSEYLYLAIRCGAIGQNGNGGHAHNDQLSFELSIKDHDFIIDGGSFLYTPVQEIRNEFRSTKAHNTLSTHGFEQNRWGDGLNGLFSMKDKAHAQVLKFSNEYFRGEHYGFGPKHYREFILKDSFLIIHDMIETTLPNEINFNLSPEVEVTFLREKGPEAFSLEMENGGDHLTISLEGFNKVESSEGYYSSGYGRRVKNTLVRCCRSKPWTNVEIAFG